MGGIAGGVCSWGEGKRQGAAAMLMVGFGLCKWFRCMWRPMQGKNKSDQDIHVGSLPPLCGFNSGLTPCKAFHYSRNAIHFSRLGQRIGGQHLILCVPSRPRLGYTQGGISIWIPLLTPFPPIIVGPLETWPWPSCLRFQVGLLLDWLGSCFSGTPLSKSHCACNWQPIGMKPVSVRRLASLLATPPRWNPEMKGFPPWHAKNKWVLSSAQPCSCLVFILENHKKMVFVSKNDQDDEISDYYHVYGECHVSSCKD